MRNRLFLVLALAVLLGGGLAFATYNAINSQPAKTVNATAPAKVDSKSATAKPNTPASAPAKARTRIAGW